MQLRDAAAAIIPCNIIGPVPSKHTAASCLLCSAAAAIGRPLTPHMFLPPNNAMTKPIDTSCWPLKHNKLQHMTHPWCRTTPLAHSADYTHSILHTQAQGGSWLCSCCCCCCRSEVHGMCRCFACLPAWLRLTACALRTALPTPGRSA